MGWMKLGKKGLRYIYLAFKEDDQDVAARSEMIEWVLAAQDRTDSKCFGVVSPGYVDNASRGKVDPDCGILRSLADVPTGCPIYVLAHGIRGANAIGNRWSGLKQSDNNMVRLMSGEELAKQMAEDGLKSDHRVIKLFTCNSGVGAAEGKGFAHAFWEAMHKREEHPFTSLWVAAYTAYVKTPRPLMIEHQWASQSEGAQELFRASKSRILIAPDGVVYPAGVEPPPFA
jgi:hypothetical protein